VRPSRFPADVGIEKRKQAPHFLLRDERLYGTREREPEDQRPEDLPEHAEGERERPPELAADARHDHR